INIALNRKNVNIGVRPGRWRLMDGAGGDVHLRDQALQLGAVLGIDGFGATPGGRRRDVVGGEVGIFSGQEVGNVFRDVLFADGARVVGKGGVRIEFVVGGLN